MRGDDMGLKRCSRCGKNKRSSSFGKSRSRKDGLNCYCLKCCAEDRKQKKESALPFVYRLKFPDGSAYYGSSNSNPNKRKSEHFSAMKRGQHWNTNVQQKFDIYGLPTFEILMLLDTIEEAIENETHLTATAHNRGTECLNVRHGNYNNTHRKLTDTEVTDIYLSKLPLHELSRRYGISQMAIRRIKNRICYKEITAGLGTAGRFHKRHVFLTGEMKSEILTSAESGVALARRFGCSTATINRFRQKNRC